MIEKRASKSTNDRKRVKSIKRGQILDNKIIYLKIEQCTTINYIVWTLISISTSDLGYFIYYILSLPIELSSREQLDIVLNKMKHYQHY